MNMDHLHVIRLTFILLPSTYMANEATTFKVYCDSFSWHEITLHSHFLFSQVV
jgi:hypothetical protein